MAITVPTAQAATQKWSTRAQGATADYKAAVSTAGARWQEATSSSGPIWAVEVQKAVANGRFESGVANKASEYQTQAAGKGANNYGGGITAGATKYTNKIGKVLGVISNVVLPPPGPRNSPQNYSRSTAIGNALNAAKMQGTFN